MNEHLSQKASGCDGRCESCTISEQAERAAVNAPLKGWAMVGCAMVYFVLPLVLAVIGAWVGRQSSARQALYGVAGLIAGMLLAGVFARRINRKTGVVT